ncbi:hypothetical protein KAR91_43885 [Candidatus Pacearchaeota archaeon]|nr:hypothetical protein [Candidatus Pacearchaeota archaeon]
MHPQFKLFKTRCIYEKDSEWPITDGAVLFEAADWKEFRDFKTGTPLTVRDLDTLGYNKEMTIDAIRTHTEELLSAELPHLIEWCRNYVDRVMQNEDKRHLCLVPEVPMEAVRSAIQKIIEFCDNAPKEEIKLKDPTISDKASSLFWKSIFNLTNLK